MLLGTYLSVASSATLNKLVCNRFNLMVLEAGAETSVRDQRKRAAMLEVQGMYRYALGVCRRPISTGFPHEECRLALNPTGPP
jgi:hypothetical protein